MREDMTSTHHPKNLSLSRIVLATDLTVESEAATDYAKFLARKFHSIVLIVHIIDRTLRTVFAAAIGRPVAAGLRTGKMKDLLRVKSNISGAGIPTREILYEGHPVNSVLTMLARQRKADLIVVAANQELAEAELNTLSMLEDVLPACRCPLIVVGTRVYRERRLPDLSTVIYIETGSGTGDLSASSYSEAFADQAGAALTTLKVASKNTASDRVEHASGRAAMVQCVIDSTEERNADLIICSLSKKKHIAQQEQLHLVRDLILLARCPVMILCT
jgi:nucleotide-binding universal stress UspA family protein